VGHDAQRLVACGVPKLVVDLLEAIEVGDQQRPAASVPISVRTTKIAMKRQPRRRSPRGASVYQPSEHLVGLQRPWIASCRCKAVKIS
jgi:hypothetical protein